MGLRPRGGGAWFMNIWWAVATCSSGESEYGNPRNPGFIFSCPPSVINFQSEVGLRENFSRCETPQYPFFFFFLILFLFFLVLYPALSLFTLPSLFFSTSTPPLQNKKIKKFSFSTSLLASAFFTAFFFAYLSGCLPLNLDRDIF